MKDRKGQEHIPGWVQAVMRTPIQTEGNLPGGGGLFETCARAVELAEQRGLPCGAALELHRIERGDPGRAPFRPVYVYRCTVCGAEVETLTGGPLPASLKYHDGPNGGEGATDAEV